MKKIALIGAPGSGKTKLAKRLVDELDQTRIVDAYVAVIQNRSDVILGQLASWIGNLQVAIGRYEMERLAAVESPKHLITCGTLIETIVHQSIYTELGMNSTDQMVRDYSTVRGRMALETLGGMQGDTWDYDHIFYLPVQADDPYVNQVDKLIPDCLTAFQIQYVTLEGDKVTQAVECIKGENEKSDGERDSGSTEGGAPIGDSSGSVSDLREQA